jgi:hypothetical protein
VKGKYMDLKENLMEEYLNSRKAMLVGDYKKCVSLINDIVVKLTQQNLIAEAYLSEILKSIENNDFEDVLFKIRTILEDVK